VGLTSLPASGIRESSIEREAFDAGLPIHAAGTSHGFLGAVLGAVTAGLALKADKKTP